MPELSSHALSDTAAPLTPPAAVLAAEAAQSGPAIVGTFVTPATPAIGMGVAGTAYAAAVPLPAETAVAVDAEDPPHLVCDTGQTHTMAVVWSGPGL